MRQDEAIKGGRGLAGRLSLGRLAGAGASGVAILAVLLLAIWLFLPMLRANGPTDQAEGDFSHDCCGILRLDHGNILLNGKQKVAFSVGRDPGGPFILPKTYIGAFEDIGFEVDGTRPPIKLRLDRLPEPNTILIREGRKLYLLKREVSRASARY